MRMPLRMALTGVGAEGWTSGSQKWSGAMAAFRPKTATKRNAMRSRWATPASLRAPTLRESWAMFKVPVVPYRVPMARSMTAAPMRLRTRYLKVASSFSALVMSPSGSQLMTKAYVERRITSKKTKRLKMSPVRKAPFTPISRNRKRGR